MTRRLTKREWRAIEAAINACLVMEVIDGFSDGTPAERAEEQDARDAMESALDKVFERLS